nr:hypothetical protein [Tanacetum cinerariifolium]
MVVLRDGNLSYRRMDPQTFKTSHLESFSITCTLCYEVAPQVVSRCVVNLGVLQEQAPRECTAVVEDPKPPTDDFEARPVKEFIIKFTVVNGKQPLTLDFKIFYESIGHYYNQGKYVAQPSPEVVKAEMAKIATRKEEVSDCVSTQTKDTGPEASGTRPQKNKKPKSKKTSLQSPATPPSEKGSHSSLDESTRKSKPFPEGKPTDAKDSKGNKQSADMGLPATIPDECISKTKPLPEGIKTDPKDSEIIKPLADTDSDDDMFKAKEEMVEYIQELETKETQTHHSTDTPIKEPHSQEHQSPKQNKDQLESSKAKKTNASDSESSSCPKTLKPYDNYMPVTERQLLSNLQNFLEILNIFKTDQNTRLGRIFENLKEVQDAVKEVPALNKKVLEAVKAYTKNSITLTELLTLWVESSTSMTLSVGPRMTMIKNTQTHIQSGIASIKIDTFEIQTMLTEMFCAFKGQSFFTPSSSMQITHLLSLKVQQLLGENLNHTATEETPFYTKREKDDMVNEEAFEKEPTKEPEAHLDKEEKLQKDEREAKLLETSKYEMIKPNNGMFFIDVFGDEAFQRMIDIHKVDIETLLTYLVMASNISSPEN